MHKEVLGLTDRLAISTALLLALAAYTDSAAAATTSFLRVAGSAADPVSIGKSWSFTSDSGTFSAIRAFDRRALVQFSSPSHYWTLDLVAPYQGRLEPGTQLGLPMFPGQALNQWAFRLIADGRQCSAAITEFTVQQVRYDSTGTVKSLIAVFDQTCAGAAGGSSGRIVFKADTSLYVVSPQDVYPTLSEAVSFNVSAVTTDGSVAAISATGLPSGATFTDLANGSAVLNWPGGSSTPGIWLVTFTATDISGRAASAVTAIRVHGPDVILLDADPGEWVTQGISHHYHRANATLSMWTNCCGAASAMATTPEDQFHLAFAAPDPRPLAAGHYLAQSAPMGEYASALAIEGPGRGCNVATGWFDVRQIEFGGGGEITRLWIFYEHHCEGGPAAVRGEIRLNADTSIYVLPPADIYVMAHRDTIFSIRGADTRGHPVTLTAESVPTGCSFADHGDGTGTLAVTWAMTQTGVIPISFSCANGLGAQAWATTWLHVYPTTASAPLPAGAAGLQLAVSGPNPTRLPLAVTFTLPERRSARIDLVDVAGRIVVSRDVGEFGPGSHRLTLAESGTLRPGFYLIRLRKGDQEVRRTAVLLR